MKYAYRLETKRVKEPDFPYNSVQKFTEPKDIAAFCHSLHDSDIEKFMVLFLDQKHKLICVFIQPGDLNHAAISSREVAKHALLSSAASVVFVHNHPSGDQAPSMEDMAMTKTIKQGLDLLNIRVLDHIILGEYGHFSFKENQVL